MKKTVLIRLYKIFHKIKTGNPTFKSILEEISFELGKVSERTIKRDISTLKYEFNLPIEYNRKRKEFYLTEACNFPFPPLTEGEVFTLLIATNLLRQFKGTPLEKDLEGVERKVEAIFSEKANIKPNQLEMALSVSVSLITPKVDIQNIFKKTFNAIMEKRRILINYHTMSSGETRERKIDPYHIFNHQGVWYLCGYCYLRKEVRDFALDRIERIEVLKDRFEIPEDFRVQEYINRAFRIYKGETKKIRIKFDAYQAKWIKERVWHETQKIEELKNGEIILEMEANPQEVKRWVMGYSSHAEVLEPGSLREEIIKDIKKISVIYSEGH